MASALIVDTVRTGISRAFTGALRETRPDALAAHCVNQLLRRNDAIDAELVEECVMGCAFPEGPQGFNIARTVALLSRLGCVSAGVTVSRQCASGLDAVSLAASRIAAGDASVMIAGGTESVSLTLRTVNDARPGLDVQQAAPDGRPVDGEPVPFWKRAVRSMSAAGEILAERYGISRDEQDAYACRSQQRTAAAQVQNRFAAEIEPIDVTVTEDFDAEGAPIVKRCRVERDECNRPDTNMDVLRQLNPVVRSDGTVTAGNAPPMADGASSALLVSEERARAWNLEPLGQFRGYAVVGCAPDEMGTSPTLAIPKLLKRHGYRLDDVGLFEINEAFAAQTIHCQRTLGLDWDRLNVNGGAISLGHPFGMTGCRMIGQLLRELRRRKQRLGVVALCAGGGLGVAALLEAFL